MIQTIIINYLTNIKTFIYIIFWFIIKIRWIIIVESIKFIYSNKNKQNGLKLNYYYNKNWNCKVIYTITDSITKKKKKRLWGSIIHR